MCVCIQGLCLSVSLGVPDLRSFELERDSLRLRAPRLAGVINEGALKVQKSL